MAWGQPPSIPCLLLQLPFLHLCLSHPLQCWKVGCIPSGFPSTSSFTFSFVCLLLLTLAFLALLLTLAFLALLLILAFLTLLTFALLTFAFLLTFTFLLTFSLLFTFSFLLPFVLGCLWHASLCSTRGCRGCSLLGWRCLWGCFCSLSSFSPLLLLPPFFPGHLAAGSASSPAVAPFICSRRVAPFLPARHG